MVKFKINLTKVWYYYKNKLEKLMNFIKDVFRKILIALVSGAVILAIVYYKDKYLEEGNSDMEMLNSVTLEKESVSKPTQNKVTYEEPEPLTIEVENPNENEITITKTEDIQPTQNQHDIVKNEQPSTEQSFDEFKSSMSFSDKNNAFDELQREIK